ncbi:Wzy polymerase domain-containing protein [Thalassotalea maritima]|uniref:PglL family O-oligosaccharyltransferase n=1 Tax=Thalassotalea maritima TaxID=3242416 RepID=UPI0035287A1F
MAFTPFNFFKICLFLYCLIGMHIALPGPGGSGLYLAPNIIGWMFICLLCISGIWQAMRNGYIRLIKPIYYLGLALFFLSIPAFYPDSSFDASLLRLSALVIILLFCITLLQFEWTKENKKFVLYCLFIAFFIEALIGVVQFFVLMQFDVYVVAYTPVANRPYGSFTQPNVMASFMACLVLLSLYMNFKNSDWRFNRHFLTLSKLAIVLASLLVVVLQSKTGYIGFLVGTLGFMALYRNKLAKHKKLIIMLFAGILLGIISISTLKVVDRGEGVYTDKGVRTDIIFVSSQLFAENAITGVGYGNFEKAYRQKHLELLNEHQFLKKPLSRLGHPHNETLFWLVEAGIFSILAMLAIFYSAWIGVKHAQAKHIMALILLMFPILFHTQTEYPFYHSIAHLLVPILLILVWFQVTEVRIFKMNKVLGFTGAVWLIPCFIYCATTLHTMRIIGDYHRFKEPQILDSIINAHSWQDFIEVTVYNQSLQNAFKNRNSDAVERYVLWGREFVQDMPRPGLYQNMLVALGVLEKVKPSFRAVSKENVLKEAELLYPDQDWKRFKTSKEI